MKALQKNVMEQLIAGSAEPLLVARIDLPDWPVVLRNAAFESIGPSDSPVDKPLADVVEAMIGRELALEVSESVRAAQETTIPVELSGREYQLALKPISAAGGDGMRYCAAYWRNANNASSPAGDDEAQQALLKAKRRIRDLSRDDPVTGLLNASAFREVLGHDWAVAAREKSRLALVAFRLQDFDDYLAVFGRHAADSCQRRVAQAMRRCLRRASDVAARISTDDGDRLIVLSHASDQGGVTDFASRIAIAVRELGLHHPRSRVAKFVTVTFEVSVQEAGKGKMTAEQFLNNLLNS